MQVPADINAPAHRMMRELADSERWQPRFGNAAVREWSTQDASFYYNVLASYARSINLWQTDYMHVLPEVPAIAEWYKGSGLRPYLDILADPDDKTKFVEEFIVMLKREYLPQVDGQILFPFKRLFLIALK